MKRKLFIISILFIMIIFSSCGVKKRDITFTNQNIELTKEQWIKDINYLEKELAIRHANVYHKLTKEEYENEFDNLRKEVPKLKDYEIKLKICQIIASVGDAHTHMLIDNVVYNQRSYPFKLTWFEDKLKVVSIDKEHKDLIGNDLIAINDISIKEVVKRVNTLISHENEQWLKVNNQEYIQFPTILKFLNIIKDDKAEFTFCDDEGKIKKVNLFPVDYEKLSSSNFVNISELVDEKKMIAYQHDYTNYYDNLYWYKYIPDDKVMYFQYNTCHDKSTAKSGKFKDWDKYPDFDEFSDRLIKELNDKEIDKLIIDLRNNTEGNSILMDNFAKKLVNVEKLNKRGKIFVLIGKRTFSSGVMACITLKNCTNAIFVGSPTGGNVNCYGEVKTMILPNSKVVVCYSTEYFSESNDYKEGFTPDILVEESYKSYLNGIDDVYEAAKNYDE